MHSFLCTDRPFRNRAPNSFVSVRITSAEIKHNISTVQQEMIKLMPQMTDVIQNPSKLHITIMVLSLQSDEDIEKCVSTNIHPIKILLDHILYSEFVAEKFLDAIFTTGYIERYMDPKMCANFNFC